MPVLRRAVPAVTIDAAGQDHQRALEGVVADQAGEGTQTGQQGVVLAAGDEQLVLVEQAAVVQFAAQGRDGAAGFVLEEVRSACLRPAPSKDSSVARAISGSLLRVPRRPSTGFVGADGGVVEQALVDVADLFDVQRPEGEAPGFRRRRQRRLLYAGVAAS